MAKRNRLQRDFFTRDVLDVAPDILSKILIVRHKDGNLGRFSVSETEAYRGTEDRACHAFSGRTRRTEIMYHNGGRIYVYLVYGIHWMLNVVTGRENEPQALLIRGLQNCSGPGRVSRTLGIDGSYYGEDLITSERVWFEDSGIVPDIKTTERIGIDYAGEYWRTRPWRFVISG